MKKIHTIGILILVIVVSLIFIYFLFRYFPLGIALSIIGGILTTLSVKPSNKADFYIGSIGSLLYPVGIAYSFIYDRWYVGILAIIIGIEAYRLAKKR